MASIGPQRATIKDLSRTPGKAELIGGRIVDSRLTGFTPHQVAFAIAVSLKVYQRQHGGGFACGDNLGFVVPERASGHESFSPDAAFHAGSPPANRMRFIEGAPTFAVEVRSENDSGPAAEVELAAKRADTFAAGTRVVWDVDPLAGLVHVDRADDPATPTTYGPGQIAEAEPAVPGGRIPVAEVFAV
jgi:Uma2 family endonuclease